MDRERQLVRLLGSDHNYVRRLLPFASLGVHSTVPVPIEGNFMNNALPLAALSLATPLLLLAGCGPAKTQDADKKAAPSATGPSTGATPTPPKPGPTPATPPNTTTTFAPPEDLNDAQKMIATEMRDLVVDYAILARLNKKCPDYAIDEPKMRRARDLLIEEAKPAFPSKDDLMVAAGATNREVLGEQVRQFYAKHNVVLESSAAEYCAVGKALKNQPNSAGRYLL